MAPSEEEIARRSSMLFLAVSWNQSARGPRLSGGDRYRDPLAIPEARLTRVGARYRVSEANGARVYSYDGLELSLPVEATGCLLNMIQRALEAEAIDGRNRARSVKLVLAGADARELPAVDAASWQIVAVRWPASAGAIVGRDSPMASIQSVMWSAGRGS